MGNELIKLETARLAERKGAGKAYNRYCKTPTVTQTAVTRWLREKKNLHVEGYRNACGYGFEISKSDNGTHITNEGLKGPNDGGVWGTYEEAIEAGILKALSLI